MNTAKFLRPPEQKSNKDPRAEALRSYMEALDRECRQILIQEARAGDRKARQMLKDIRAGNVNL